MEGKIETIIMSGSWKGIDYRRSKSNRRNFEPTEKAADTELTICAYHTLFTTNGGFLPGISFLGFAIMMTGINNVFCLTPKPEFISS